MTCPLLFVKKRGSSFGIESNLVLRGKVSIGNFFSFFFLIGEVYIFCRDVVRFYMYFLLSLLTLASCILVF